MGLFAAKLAFAVTSLVAGLLTGLAVMTIPGPGAHPVVVIGHVVWGLALGVIGASLATMVVRGEPA